MPMQDKPPVTQRAYTLRVRGADPNDQSWRNALWQTHEAVNKGAKAFGDWLLTLRGGLDHTLADVPAKGAEGKTDLDSIRAKRKTRRILLALSWLSVESKIGAPDKFIVASGQDAANDRNQKVLAAFEEILGLRGLTSEDIEEWKNDCSASLRAAIRDDAVWVNRSKAFDDAVDALKKIGSSLTREEVWDMLERFLGRPDAYLAPATRSEDESSETEQEEKAKDLVKNARDWLSKRFGPGKGANFSHMADVYREIAAWAGPDSPNMSGAQTVASLAAALSKFNPKSEDLQGILDLLSGPGYKSATRTILSRINDKTIVTQEDLKKLKEKAAEDEKKCQNNIGSKGKRAYADIILKDVEMRCGLNYRVYKNGQPVSVANYNVDYKLGANRLSEFDVMLDHAARRVSLAHTWIKLAEAERSNFEEDAKKLNQVPKAVKDWLDQFCLERSAMSGALEPYRIRRRAVDGWKEVVAAWSKSSCNTSADRIAAARALQDNPEIDKFGDIQLFEALAEDDAVCVWHKDGDATKDPDPQPLLDYALAAEAEFKKQHFKVPAYRHPDTLLHPVFCDFGESRWKISFDIHKNLQTPFPHALSLTLWTGSEMKPVPLRWQSKRLVHDLALGQKHRNAGPSEVTRADRLGRAASNVTKSAEVKISGLFEQEYWNGRLQAPREQFEAIAAIRDNPNISDQERMQRMSAMKERIRWLVTFSARLNPRGPWCDFAERNQLRIDPQYWPHAEANKTRKGQARLILSRLPGLRVLSVDLGHRYAAACAVWEALSADKVNEACRAAGREEPKEHDLYLHLKRKVKMWKKGNLLETEKTTIYRRIGANTLPDGTQHPAPWARLDRQFLIKLQGEKEGVREASNEEIWAVHQMEANLYRSVPLIDRLVKAGWGLSDKQKTRLDALRELGWKAVSEAEVSDGIDEDENDIRKPSLSVDELMSSAVRTMRLALKRHGDRARIAFAMTAPYKTMPGDRKYYFTEAKELSANDDQIARENKHIEFIQDALVLWHGLASSRGWRDNAAKQLWNVHIANLSGYKALEEIVEDADGLERKKKQKENRERLYEVAKALAQNATLQKTLHDAWKARWEEDDERWKKQLRWFKNWILPRGKAANNPAIRKVGGLSLTRLATLTEFRRKVQVGFFTRLHPDGNKTETREKFGQSTIDALEHLREQRVKQLASRIAEAALGIGSENYEHWQGSKRAQDKINDPCFAPCHAIVIEDLTHYRPEESRTRRENRQLMTWSSSKVKKYLSEACQLYGLHLREVSASYTSRQDSRTGAPGIRCQDVPINEFMRSPFWRKQVAQAERKQAEGKGDSRDRLLCKLNAIWKDKAVTTWQKAGIVRVPLKGGEIFVSADSASPAANGIQADLNAAANIGLRALNDPDWPGKWWYVPCEPVGFKPVKDKLEGSAAVKPDRPLRQPAQAQSGDASTDNKKRGKKVAGKSKEVVNLWRDISSSPIECIECGEWKEYAAYQNEVQCRVIRVLEERVKHCCNQPHDTSMENDIPF